MQPSSQTVGGALPERLVTKVAGRCQQQVHMAAQALSKASQNTLRVPVPDFLLNDIVGIWCQQMWQSMAAV